MHYPRDVAIVFVSLGLAFAAPLPRLEAASFIRGDVDRNGNLEITDAIKVLGHLFLGDMSVACLDAADANDNGGLDIADCVYILNFLFLGGTAPSAPFPTSGEDPTADALDCGQGLDQVRRWNQIAIDASGLDHKPPGPGEVRGFREQMGPGRSSRAMAIVHIAIFEAMNAIAGGYESYVHLTPGDPGASLEAAVTQAAHDTL